MKTLRIADDVHQKLTSFLGELMAQTSKMQTYQDAIVALMNQVEGFIEKNKRLGYTTKEEFVRDAIRVRLDMLSEGSKLIEIPKERYILLSKAVKEMDLQAISAEMFIDGVISDTLETYRQWLQQRGEKPEITEEDEITYG